MNAPPTPTPASQPLPAKAAENTKLPGASHHGPVFDADVLGALFDHEAQVIAMVLQTFVSSTNASLAELAVALAAPEDLPSVASLAHKVMGAGRLSGAPALAELAHRLELAARQEDRAALRDGLQDLDAQWSLVRAAIAALPREPSLKASAPNQGS